MLEPVNERIRRDEQFELLPCVWLNLATLRCQHYDYRPQACRDFEIGSVLCRLSRDDEGDAAPESGIVSERRRDDVAGNSGGGEG
ncbi:MAG: hypothetical protein RLZZ458_1632 [Planctomycetota bacterium]